MAEDEKKHTPESVAAKVAKALLAAPAAKPRSRKRRSRKRSKTVIRKHSQ